MKMTFVTMTTSLKVPFFFFLHHCYFHIVLFQQLGGTLPITFLKYAKIQLCIIHILHPKHISILKDTSVEILRTLINIVGHSFIKKGTHLETKLPGKL